MWPFSRKISLDTQLQRLATVGLVLNPGVGEADLLAFESRAELEARPYRGLIAALGRDIEREPFTPIVDRLWMCDYERIEDRGDYRDVLLRLERMTGCALDIAEVDDHIDLDGGKASVQFGSRLGRVRWDLKVEDDWLDPEVLVRYDELLARSHSRMRLFSNVTDYGQSALLGAFVPEAKAALDRLTPIKMVPVVASL